MGILDEVESIVKLVQQIDNKELYNKILELQNSLMEIQQENLELKMEKGELKSQIEAEKYISFRDGSYWKNINEANEDGPFCTVCWDSQRKLVRPMLYENRELVCYNCKLSWVPRNLQELRVAQI